MLDNSELDHEIAKIMKRGAKRLKITNGNKNPWLRFPPEKIIELAGLIHLENQMDVLRLSRILGNIAEWFYVKEQMVDFQLTPTKRKLWLKEYIAKPAQQLIDALESKNDKMFIEVYEDFDKEFIDSLKGKPIVKKEVTIRSKGRIFAIVDLSTRDFNGALHERLLMDLTSLKAWAIKKYVSLGKKKNRNWNRTRHKEELVVALLKTYIFLGPKPPFGKGRRVKRIKAFIQEAANPILGRHDNLSTPMKKAIASHKKMENKTFFEPTFFPKKWFYEES